MAYIELNGVSIGFGSGRARVEVLADVNLHIEKGEFVALLGYSGTGKTTLMNLVAGLLLPDRGEVVVDGRRVTGPGPDRGLVFQNYSLLPWLDVRGNIALAVDQLFGGESRARREERVRTAIERVNLAAAVHKKPGELSGGMRQRTSVARTLAMDPEILLLDEPLSALDALTRAVVQDQILGIWRELGQTVLLVTNDIDEGLYMADRIVPIGVGPPAALGPETKVGFPRPRDRRDILSGTAWQGLRHEVISFLLAEKERERSAARSAPVLLPNIRPADLERPGSVRFIGGRPAVHRKPRKSIF